MNAKWRLCCPYGSFESCFFLDFAALDKLFAKHAGLGGELKLLNTVFAYLRDKRNFFNSPGAAQSVSNLAKKFADGTVGYLSADLLISFVRVCRGCCCQEEGS